MNQPNARDQIYEDIINSFATMLEIMIERDPDGYSVEGVDYVQETDEEEKAEEDIS